MTYIHHRGVVRAHVIVAIGAYPTIRNQWRHHRHRGRADNVITGEQSVPLLQYPCDLSLGFVVLANGRRGCCQQLRHTGHKFFGLLATLSQVFLALYIGHADVGFVERKTCGKDAECWPDIVDIDTRFQSIPILK